MKKLMMFLMVMIPVLVICIVKFTTTTVVGDVFISVESISLDNDKVSAKVGDELDLGVSIYPDVATNQEISWQSSNINAAVVDMSGHVKFVGIGSGYITATSQDGSKRSQCSFYVWDTKVHKVELTAPSRFVYLGKDLSLSVTVLPDEALDKAVDYTSSDEKIATVDPNGSVYGVSEGVVQITATSHDGGYKSVVEISVIKPVTALDVRQSEIITASSTVQIEPLVIPEDASNRSVEFEVDNPDIAMVNQSGLVTFKKQGQVNVKVTTIDGKFERIVKIICTGGYAYDLTISAPTINLNLGSQAVPINYQVFPEGIYKTSVEISSEDNDIARVDAQGYIHAVSVGNTIVTLKVYTSENKFIEKRIYVNVECPATAIDIAGEVMTAERTYQLNPKSLPSNSTNTKYFYHIQDSVNATVSERGLVVFNGQTPCTVTVRIYANEDGSGVYKDVKILYTAGGVAEFELITKNIEMMYDETATIEYTILPSNAFSKQVTLVVVENRPVVPNGNVVEIVDGKIHAIGGGTAKVKAIVLLYDQKTLKEEYVEVSVTRDVSDIQIELDLQNYNGQYLTSERTVEFSANVLPADATDKNIVWSLKEKDVAVIHNGTLIFNQIGAVTLVATIGNVSRSVEIYYTGSVPAYVDVKSRMNGQEIEVPKKLMAGDRLEIILTNIIPHFETTPKFTLQIQNQKTSSLDRNVLSIDGNFVTATAGGTVTLVVYLSSTLRYSFDITVEMKPQEVLVAQAKTQVTTDIVILESEVLPYDTTNKSVRYLVKNPDVATVVGSTLTFKKNGVVYITAICEANENIKLEFYIEKIDKDAIYITPNQTSVEIRKGDIITFKNFGTYNLQITANQPYDNKGNVVLIEGNSLKAVSSGVAVVSVITTSKIYSIEITVVQLVEDIVFNTTADIYGDEYLYGSNVVELNFGVLPSYASNQKLNISISQSASSDGVSGKFAYLDGNKVHFSKAGYAILQVESEDGNCIRKIKLRYTGGDAVDAVLNIGDDIILNVGEEFTVKVLSWVPTDTTNTNISIYEINTKGQKLTAIDVRTNTIRAVAKGKTKIIIELSSGIFKEINLTCVVKATDIEVEANVYTSSSTHTIVANIIPSEAGQDKLEYILQNTTIATIQGNVVTFTNAGTVTVIIRTTDGTDVEKSIQITSTMGYVEKLELAEHDLSLSRGSSIQLMVTKSPIDAQLSVIHFIVLSQTPKVAGMQVVTVSADGELVAVGVGTAVVKVYTQDFYGKEVAVECNISVYSRLEAIDVQFDKKLDTYQNQNTFVTGKTEIGFTIISQPDDATITRFAYDISNPLVAKIEGNNITFMQTGRVTITFKCYDDYGDEETKTYIFQYVGDDLLEATLDRTKMVGDEITLYAGDTFEFSLLRSLPSDVDNISFTIREAVEHRNDANKQVAEFENGRLHAMNGGSYEFTLYANGLLIGRLKLVVKKDAVDVNIDGEQQVYISTPSYRVNAHVVESDSHQSIAFKIQSNVATITPDGLVEFSEYGECEVTVFIAENPSIFKIIKIYYTKELRGITLNKTKEKMYIGEAVYLYVSAQPADASDFKYTIKIDNENVARLEKYEDGYRLTGLAKGMVTVTVQVEGKDIKITRVFTIYEKIRQITFELDASGDKYGYVGYRVFGNRFISGTNAINTYQMAYTLIPSSVTSDLLEWSSSNTDVAEVDQNGLVTFKTTGRVVITAKQIAPYEGANVVSDSYEFNIIDGINVSTLEQFNVASGILTNNNKDKTNDYEALILHQDIVLPETTDVINLKYNLYGNGHTLKHSNLTLRDHFIVSGTNNLIIDNVVLSGLPSAAQSMIKGQECLLNINLCTNILVYNTRIQYSETAIKVLNAQVRVEGCIFDNISLCGMMVYRRPTGPSDVTIKDSIFATSIFGIAVVPDTNGDAVMPNTFHFIGEVRFYNFKTLDQIEHSIDVKAIAERIGLPVSFVVSEAFDQLEAATKSKTTAYQFNYNGQIYYNFGFFQIGGRVPILGLGGGCTSELDKTSLNPSCNYSEIPIPVGITLVVAMEGEIFALSLRSEQAFIRPGETYVNNTALLAKIIKPCRF